MHDGFDEDVNFYGNSRFAQADNMDKSQTIAVKDHTGRDSSRLKPF